LLRRLTLFVGHAAEDRLRAQEDLGDVAAPDGTVEGAAVARCHGLDDASVNESGRGRWWVSVDHALRSALTTYQCKFHPDPSTEQRCPPPRRTSSTAPFVSKCCERSRATIHFPCVLGCDNPATICSLRPATRQETTGHHALRKVEIVCEKYTFTTWHPQQTTLVPNSKRKTHFFLWWTFFFISFFSPFSTPLKIRVFFTLQIVENFLSLYNAKRVLFVLSFFRVGGGQQLTFQLLRPSYRYHLRACGRFALRLARRHAAYPTRFERPWLAGSPRPTQGGHVQAAGPQLGPAASETCRPSLKSQTRAIAAFTAHCKKAYQIDGIW
jgi:hypothetical protein